MDSKLSDYPSIGSVAATDIVPIISTGNNKKVSIGVLSLNFPNLGNKGITKNVVYRALESIIPVTATVVLLEQLDGPYTLPDGSDGQELVLISVSNATVLLGQYNMQLGSNSQVVSNNITNISMQVGSSITLLYINALGAWVPKSIYACTTS